MVNPTLTYDNEYNRRLKAILDNYDDIQASSNPPTMVVGGMKQRKYINSGNTPYDGREGTAHFSGSLYGGYCGECEMCGSAMSGGQVSGGKVNRLKKAKKWTAFAVDTAKQGIDLFKKFKGGARSGGQVSGGAISGGKVNRLKKAKKWTAFAVDTAKQGLDLFKKFKGGARSGGMEAIQDSSYMRKPKSAKATGYGRPANPWIQHVKAYQAQHGVSYKEAMKLAKASYR
jgi:hypothetical protein